MTRGWVVAILIADLTAGGMATPQPAQAQGKRPKIDSLLVELGVAKAAALDSVLLAFTQAGLTITNTTPSLIEADQGETTDEWGGSTKSRVVRAVLVPTGESSTRILITGTEIRKDKTGTSQRQLRIDNKAGGNGRKIWVKMLAAARALQPSAVMPEAEPGTQTNRQPPASPRSSAPVPRAQAAVPASDAPETIPPGIFWVADQRSRTFVPAGCRAVAAIAPAERMYYQTEESAKADGYKRSEQC